MPVKLGALLKSLAGKAKIDLSKPEYAGLLAADIDVPDDFSTALENNLFDEEAGKNHVGLNTYFRAKNLNGVDAKVDKLIEEYGLSAEDAAEIKAEKNSYEKIALATAKVKASIEGKFAGKGDAAKLQQEIQKLNADLVKAREDAQKEKQAILAESEGKILDYAVDSYLGSQNYANAEIPAKVNVLTAKSLLNEQLKAKGVKVVRAEDGSLKLLRSDDSNLEYTENNKSVPFSDFASSVLASNKLLKVKGEPVKTPMRQHQPNPEKGTPDNSKVLTAFDTEIAKVS